MTLTLLVSCALLVPVATPSRSETPRKPNPFAPSLPQLTDKEEENLDRIIDRFIDYDTGKLRGAEGKKALEDFQRLGPEAAFALIRGVNRAADIEASCPAVLIAKKLKTILYSTDDRELLLFARENIGLGVTSSRHKTVLQGLKVACIIRQRSLGRKTVATVRTTPGQKSSRFMSTGQLVQAVGSEHGPRLRQLLIELEKRSGDQVFAALGSAATTYDKDIQKLARQLLDRHMARQSAKVLKEKLTDDRSEVRAAAVRAIANKRLRFGAELIDLLTDDAITVRQAAHDALVRLNQGNDFGPASDASEADQARAVQTWRAWWAKQGSADSARP